MKKLTPLQNLLFRIGALLMLLGAALFLFHHLAACILFATGTALFCYFQSATAYEGRNLNILRLRRQQMLSRLFLLVSACAMCMLTWDLCKGEFLFRYVHHNEWVVFLCIGALLQLYTTFRISSEWEKERNQ